MRPILGFSIPFSILVLLGGLLFTASGSGPRFDPLPAPVSNNALASVKTRGATLVYSLMGIGAKKTWDDIANAAYVMDPDAETRNWVQVRSIPGTAGRIATTAVGARGLVFLLGGYVVVDARGGEVTVPDVNIYDPGSDRWARGEDIPVPVGDAVAGVYRDRYIYLIGGRSNNDGIQNVQEYDTEKRTWSQATPIAGTPVFGHAGAVVEDTIIYVDGAHKNSASDGPRYVASDECWLGKIDHKDPAKIQWSKLPNHPGAARYRIAAGGAAKDQKIYFSGGTDNPYNFNGIGYDGQPSEPSPVTFAFDLRSGKWETIEANTPDPSMDHHGLIVLPEGLLIAGGMEKGQQVTARVSVLPKPAKEK